MIQFHLCPYSNICVRFEATPVSILPQQADVSLSIKSRFVVRLKINNRFRPTMELVKLESPSFQQNPFLLCHLEKNCNLVDRPSISTTAAKKNNYMAEPPVGWWL